MHAWHSQDHHVVRVEWGPTGAEGLTAYAVRSGAAVAAVVVDVLSFTTCVSVGVDAGMRVHPYRWKDETAQAYADSRRAVLAQPRSRARTKGGISLSPSSIREASAVSDLVLPSPNGSTISALLADAGAEVVAASLRNHRAVAAWLVERLEAARGRQPAVVLVPAGERWPDGSLRPAVEDLWGAGAVVAALAARLEHRGGPLLLSPEAVAAAAAWTAVEDGVSEALLACASGRELVEQGWPEDVAVAAEVDASDVVPVLRDGVFASLER
ncbi:2-phosphosulfolactate phosphatase [Monashia sp. NPDC004114]